MLLGAFRESLQPRAVVPPEFWGAFQLIVHPSLAYRRNVFGALESVVEISPRSAGRQLWIFEEVLVWMARGEMFKVEPHPLGLVEGWPLNSCGTSGCADD
jgi:hypothetical protein